MKTKRKSLKTLFLSRILIAAILIIAVITICNMQHQSSDVIELSENLLARDSVSYAEEIRNWWGPIEARVQQTATILRDTPNMSNENMLRLLKSLTANDEDSQDIYIGNANNMTFLDGSGWKPGADFVFTDRSWFKGAIENNGKTFTSEPYLDASTQKMCLACSSLVKDGVVLSSDITFEQMEERVKNFHFSYKNVLIYVINKDTGDILVSNDSTVVGTKVSDEKTAVTKGLNSIYAKLKTDTTPTADKVLKAKTSSGQMMYTGTDVSNTSWLVVSATPYSFIQNKIKSTLYITLLISIVLLVLMGCIIYYIINRHLGPVSLVSGRIDNLNNGDFISEIKPQGNDEITTLSEQLNDYIGHMRSLLLHLTNMSDDMSDSAEKCIHISGVLNNSNSSQSESIEELNAQLGDLSQSIDTVANATTELATVSANLENNAHEVRTICEETIKVSESGRNEMKGMTESVTTLSSTIDELIKIIRVTAETAEEIKGITNTISDISSQTNLLSLNASIEAARAGEMGKGFAVVAGEVGNLANQSTEAAVHIGELIETITRNINSINDKADDCLRDMKSCLAGVERSNQSFDSIFEDVSKATDGITEIVDGVSRINNVASDNAAATQQQAAAVTQIVEISDSIVNDSTNISSETEKLSDVSKELNGFSTNISDELKNFTLE